eukprot:543995_1
MALYIINHAFYDIYWAHTFPNLNDKSCVHFKYHDNMSTRTISSILQYHITTAAEYGDTSIVPIICDDIGRYFTQNTNNSMSIRCYYSPREFVQLLEFAMSHPWRLLKEAMLSESYPLSIFFNGNKEEEDGSALTVYEDSWYDKMTKDVHSIFNDMIDKYFDRSDNAWMSNVIYQLMNCCLYFLNLSVECEAKNELIGVLLHYIQSSDVLWFGFDNTKYLYIFGQFKLALGKRTWIDPPPSKKRRIK